MAFLGITFMQHNLNVKVSRVYMSERKEFHSILGGG